MPVQFVYDPNGAQGSVINGATIPGVATSHSLLDPPLALDTIYFGLGGADTIIDTNANSWIWGNVGDSSNVSFYGNGGADILVSFNGNDFLDGGADNDILISGAGNDTVLGGSGMDSLWGGAGADFLNGGDDADTVVGGGGGTALQRDVLWGGDHDSARDIIIGTVGSADNFVTSGNSWLGNASFVDIFWNFTVGEDIITLRTAAGSTSSNTDAFFAPVATGTGNYNGTGLSGIVIQSAGFDVAFLAGVSTTTTTAQLNAAYTFQTY